MHSGIPPTRHNPLDQGTRHTPLDQAHTPGPGTPCTRHPPWEETPLAADPPAPDTPQTRHPPELGTPQHRACWEIQSTRGQYASYWNAIFFCTFFLLKLHDNERIWTEMGCASPVSRSWIHHCSQNRVVLLQTTTGW